MRGRLELHHLDAELAALRVEQLRVEQHAVALHGLQHCHHRHLDVAVDFDELGVAFYLRIERVMQLQRNVGVFRRIIRGALDRYLVETDLARSLAAHLDVRERLYAQMARGEVIHIVRLMTFQHVRLQQRIVRDPVETDSVVGEHVRVVLEVLSELCRMLVLQPRLELRQRRIDRELRRGAGVVVRERQVGRVPGLDRK